MVDWVSDSKAALVSLYARGSAYRVAGLRARWPRVVSALVHSPPSSAEEVPHVLLGAGLLEEANVLSVAGALEYGAGILDGGHVLTVFDLEYPVGWFDALGTSAPPVLYRRGAPLREDSQPEQLELGTGVPLGAVACVVAGLTAPGGEFFDAGNQMLLGVAGSRTPSVGALEFAKELSQVAAQRGVRLVAGGAEGFDAACLQFGGVALLPYGFDCHLQRFETELTVCAPDERFSSGTAMERNALVYASGPAAVVAEPRFRVGGSWHGAVDCLRRRSSLLHVFGGAPTAVEALSQIGAVPVSCAGQVSVCGNAGRASRLVQESRLPYVA